MLITKTAKLEDVANKGQRAIIVKVLSKLEKPITLEKLTEKVIATGEYNGKGWKGTTAKVPGAWVSTKAGGDLGSVRYHLRYLAAEGRVKLQDGVEPVKPKKAAKKAKAAEPAPEIPSPEGQEAERELEELGEEVAAPDAA
jgi:hypothetical protein